MPEAPGQPRDYTSITPPDPEAGSIEARMRALTDSLWDALHTQNVSWIGFYFGPGWTLEDARTVGDAEMLLGPCRNKPACSPIGLHGACGKSLLDAAPLVVHDVKDLGEGYVACDPRDQSEVVIPLFDESGRCYAVLDADSFDVGAFDERDARELARLCAEAGLTSR